MAKVSKKALRRKLKKLSRQKNVVLIDGVPWEQFFAERQARPKAAVATRRLDRTKTPLSETVMPFGAFAGKAFDETPLGYLDWLIGQDWLYGEFKTRLTKYLSHPIVVRELEALFPEDWDDSRQPAFTVQQFYDRWHGQPMPKEVRDETVRHMTRTEAWDVAADLANWCGEVEDPVEVLEMDFGKIKEACSLLPAKTATMLRNMYVACRERLRKVPLVSDEIKIRAELLGEALEELSREPARP